MSVRTHIILSSEDYDRLYVEITDLKRSLGILSNQTEHIGNNKNVQYLTKIAEKHANQIDTKLEQLWQNQRVNF